LRKHGETEEVKLFQLFAGRINFEPGEKAHDNDGKQDGLF